ncbi:MAG: SpoIIE family protein phosphatase [Bacteroidales bacterium]|jgi:sigma-B regulation protein RsbU (phosphoserine phosphatase)|nr:SpoIIE family protein phosphatase [Bacteroidales bacterium]
MIEKNTVRQTLKFKLDSLLEITRSINENQSVEALLEKYIDILCHKLKIGKVVMFKYSNQWECILNAGAASRIVDNIDVEKDLLLYSDITFIASEEDILPGFDIVIPVFNNNTPIAYVLIGDIEEEMEGVSPVIKHLQFIQTISNIIVVAIENIRLFQESLQQEAIKRELELASQMQNMLVPDIKDLPRNKFISVNAFYKSHYDVGGDYFDCIDLKKNKIGFCVADVSGKGLAAALLASNFQATLQALFTWDIPMEKLLQKLNRRISARAKGEKFITLFIGRYDYNTREMEYVNAGHTPVILYNTESKKMDLLESSTVAVGMLDELPFVNVKKITIDEHTLLLSYTDGIVEVISDTEEGEVDSAFYVLENAVQQFTTVDDVIENIITTQNLRGQNEAIFDDITLLGVEFFPK